MARCAKPLETIFDFNQATTLEDVDGTASLSDADPLPIPEDHSDPNHPHNGDIETQLNGQAQKPRLSKRVVWAIVTATLLLGTMGAAMGLGWWYGKKHGRDHGLPAPTTSYATLDPSTTIEFTTAKYTATTAFIITEAVVGMSTMTMYVTQAPPAPCITAGTRWPTEDECTDHCHSVYEFKNSYCRPIPLDLGHWQCLHCPKAAKHARHQITATVIPEITLPRSTPTATPPPQWP